MPTRVNDLHSQLNATEVDAVERPATIEALEAIVRRARTTGHALSIAGGHHSMGGQQFAANSILIDTRALDRITAFDPHAGLVTVEGGIHWPALLEFIDREQREQREQRGGAHAWGIYQKQTGADRLSLGGALSCNAHGRGLTLAPIVQQVDSFDLLNADGEILTCSRQQHPELFRLAIGGYGLFGVIARVTLRLRPRLKLQRVVRLIDTADLMAGFEDRIRDGFLYGDFQFTIDHTREDFLRRGVFSCYAPMPADTPLTDRPVGFSADEWRQLIQYAHTNKHRAFQIFAVRYLQTSGQIYCADAAQLSSAYVECYHDDLDRAVGATVKGSEMITEVYVERSRLAAFMEDARKTLRDRRANLIYGTVRLIERDDETFLPWARDRYACIVFNLHVDHTAAAISAAADTFRDLIDLAIWHGGSYYLAYHRWARTDQVERCYPAIGAFLDAKRRYDPDEMFQSEWYRHYQRTLGLPSGGARVMAAGMAI